MTAQKRGRNLNEILADRRARRRERLRAIFFSAFVIIAGIVLYLHWRERSRRPEMEAFRVVVAPLDNRTGNPALDTLGLVASDWITRNLSYYAPGREVVPTTTTLSYLRSARLARYELFERALHLAHGTRAQILVWGSYYVSNDSLRFSVEVTDLKTNRMMGSVPQVATSTADPLRGIDQLRSAVIGAVLRTESIAHPIARLVPKLDAYEQFVGGLDAYVREDFHNAAALFGAASSNDARQLPHQIWLVEALYHDRQFFRADSVAHAVKGFNIRRAYEARAMRSLARLREDPNDVYGWTQQLVSLNGADDLARYELVMITLGMGRVREALRMFAALKPHHGYLHGKPEFYLHYAAAYHLAGNHRAELNVVRSGIKVRERALDNRLANCRVRAALGRAPYAMAAARAIASNDTDTIGATVTVGAALDECAAELGAHGLNDVAIEATRLASAWYGARARPAPMAPDSNYERAYVMFEEARMLANRGQRGPALNALGDAVYNGLPLYEPGRMMLHAEPAFRTLRSTRGFLRINQPRG